MPVNAAKRPIRREIALPEVAVTPLPEVLPDDVDALKALLHSQLAEQQQAARTVQEHLLRHIEYLYEQIVLLRHRQFGIKAEHLPAQSRLFDEAEALEADSTPEQDQAGIPAQSSTAQDKQAKPARCQWHCNNPHLWHLKVPHPSFLSGATDGRRSHAQAAG
ncbi:hypothetical protein GG851_27410 [Bordetella petrii]|uniref:Transposase TnpC homeodomain domain-containing protein n=1 Tax=Bordetella petrii (strain ATCC BAA-461 / DSM 12804 / CCUG 43448 / CIP 107267 / Se-1111R) TaxID=340100 RepID=A9IBT8_BORPD|nr:MULTISPECIES: hypothetical protein [Alcaligenaceae]MBO9357736.1 hypothetical protein [Bordetella petrii]CAP41482.1 hypothetical protein predicted by Glimmer/Critica [Bordetella petrii]